MSLAQNKTAIINYTDSEYLRLLWKVSIGVVPLLFTVWIRANHLNKILCFRSNPYITIVVRKYYTNVFIMLCIRIKYSVGMMMLWTKVWFREICCKQPCLWGLHTTHGTKITANGFSILYLQYKRTRTQTHKCNMNAKIIT